MKKETKQDAYEALVEMAGDLRGLADDLDVYKAQLLATSQTPTDEMFRIREIVWLVERYRPLVEVMSTTLSTSLVMNEELNDRMNNPGGPGSVL